MSLKRDTVSLLGRRRDPGVRCCAVLCIAGFRFGTLLGKGSGAVEVGLQAGVFFTMKVWE